MGRAGLASLLFVVTLRASESMTTICPARELITTGSVNRDEASIEFPFLATNVRGRRAAIKSFTHLAPEFVFWIGPDGTLHDAKDAHSKNPPRGFQHIVKDPPDYGGFLRGRIASQGGRQLIVVYCRADALAFPGPIVRQFVAGAAAFPVPVSDNTLVVSDNGDLYGTLSDLRRRGSD